MIKKQKATVQGRSMLFNILFVILNLCGLALVVIGSHAAFQDYFLVFNFLGYIIIALSAAGICFSRAFNVGECCAWFGRKFIHRFWFS